VAVDEQRLGRAAQVALAIRRAFQELSVRAEVLPWRRDVAASGLVFARPDGTGAVRSVSSPARLPTSWSVLRELVLAQGVNPD